MNYLKTIIKTRIHLVLLVGAVLGIVLSSCKKEDDENNPISEESLASEVTGTYTGELKNSTTNQSRAATLTVTMQNDSLVSMHCIAEGFDSTIFVQLYQNHDSIMVCYTGQEFYNQYGHNLNNYNFCNNKPSSWNSNWCTNNSCWGGEDNWNAWTNHLNTQHDHNDMHFGGFNPGTNSCNYMFNVNEDNTNYFEVFNGIKNN